MSTVAFVFGAAIAAATLFVVGRALVRWRKRRAEERLQEAPWSEAAIALLAEPLQIEIPGAEPLGPELSGPSQPEAEQILPLIRQLLEAVSARLQPQLAAVDPDEVRSEDSSTFAEGETARLAFRQLLYDMPLRAGSSQSPEETIAIVAAAALNYYRFGLSGRHPELPISAMQDDKRSTASDRSIIGGYIELEQRLGRIPTELDAPEIAATLLGAAAAHALGVSGTPGAADEQFVQAAVATLLSGPAGTWDTEPKSGARAEPETGWSQPEPEPGWDGHGRPVRWESSRHVS